MARDKGMVVSKPTVPQFDDAMAAEMLAQLAEHFGEPVMPVSTYCNKLRQWGHAIHDAVARGDEGWGLKEISQAIGTVFLAIEKSALLNRLIYEGEDIRTEKCPVHKGKWSGCAFKLEECANEQYPQGCMSGSNVTGWLPTPEQIETQRKWFAGQEHLTCSACGRRFHKVHENDCPYCVEKSWNGKCFCAA